MSVKSINRRMFLSGTGGFMLALPFLPSLADAKARSLSRPKRLIAIGTHHGAAWEKNMFPNRMMLTESSSHAGHTIRRGPLVGNTANSQVELSPILRASQDLLSAKILEKINVINGVDIPHHIGHHDGGHLGNFAACDGESGDEAVIKQFPRQTIDQVLAWSKTFYPDLATIRERSIAIGQYMSFGYSSPSTQSGNIQPVHGFIDFREIFDKIYVAPPDKPDDPRPLVVDRVIENYSRLKQSNRRLSREDRRRLDEHIERLFELQRKLKVVTSCDEATRPEESAWDIINSNGFPFDITKHKKLWSMYIDLLMIAITCDTCRIFTMQIDELIWMEAGHMFASHAGDWHQDIAHQADLEDGSAQATLIGAYQGVFENVFLDIANRLDIEEADGKTFLDNSLLTWTQESGVITHNSFSIPIITAGSAGGYFRTGQYVDYRNLDHSGMVKSRPEVSEFPGLTYNQWLGMVLQSMGLSPSEFEQDGVGGYGKLFVGDFATKKNLYASSVLQNLSDSLPFIKA